MVEAMLGIAFAIALGGGWILIVAAQVKRAFFPAPREIVCPLCRKERIIDACWRNDDP